jgi:hypothetical protein
MVAVAGDTVTDATGARVTVTVAVPVLPSLVAVMVAEPALTAVTRPLELTEAIPPLELVHVMVRPVRMLLFASRVTADSCTVPPTVRLGAVGDTVTVATGTGAGAVTVTADVPVCPSLKAVMVAEPALTAVTRPLELTEATPAFELDHEMARPVRMLPFASRVTADNCIVPPTVRLGAVGDTVTVATGIGAGGGGALTVSAAEPVCPSLVAMMLVEPALTAVTTPLELTEATPAFELDHETARPVRSFPFASRRVAVALAVCPMTSEDGLSVTNTSATGTGGGAITVKLASPRTPSLVALITAVPANDAEITPASVTLAIAELELSQTIGRPERGAPLPSLGVATACCVWPATIDGEGSVTETAATGFRSISTEVPPDEHAVAPKARPATARIMVRMTRPSR